MFYMSFQALTALMEHMFYRTNVHHSPPGGHWRTDVLLDAPSMPGPLEAERWFLEQIYEYGATKKEVEPLFGFLSLSKKSFRQAAALFETSKKFQKVV